jgi:RluA family pseudouridine synthase
LPKPPCIELSREVRIPILFEDRSVIAIDKPPGWMLVPVSWQRTSMNLQAAILSSIAAGHFWARSRNLKFLKYIHRLDAETSGILLLAKSYGALETFSDLFETRRMEKIYLAVTDREPPAREWNCQLSLGGDRDRIGRVLVDPQGKPAETDFRVVASANGRHLIEARPYTGRQHQIRVHMAQTGCPIAGDEIYGRGDERGMALRASGLAYRDPFTRKPVCIRAPAGEFLNNFGFAGDAVRMEFKSVPPSKAGRPPGR